MTLTRASSSNISLFFNVLGLKKLIATCYAGSPIAQRQLSLFDTETPTPNRKPYCAVIECMKDYNGNGRIDILDAEYVLQHGVGGSLRGLHGDGDFRSPECVELLKEANIVATNPPFSLFREFVALMMKHDKKFIIIGSKNAITYKEIFPLIMQNKLWLGVGFNGGNARFRIPTYDPEKYSQGVYDPDSGLVTFRNVCWFTNLAHRRYNETMILVMSYKKDPSKYPHYDNYDAIEVSKTVEIPYDYDGIMGVPVTFMDKYNPKQFEIVGITQRDSPLKTKVYTRDDAPKFADLNARATIRDKDGRLRSTYARLLIRKIADFI